MDNSISGITDSNTRVQAKRLFCDSFVLSIKCDDDKIFCGLNNGSIQAWDLATLGKTREQECHDKGVKCIDMNNKVFLTGSYDTTFKVSFTRQWILLFKKVLLWEGLFESGKFFTMAQALD